MRFSVESWNPDYGSPVQDLGASPTHADVRLDVEVETWRSVPRSDVEVPTEIAFVDGVRRIDAQIWVPADVGSTLGVCASIGAGVIHCWPDRAVIGDVKIERRLFVPSLVAGGASATAAGGIATASGTYQLQPIDGAGPEDLMLAVDAAMADLEVSICERIGEGVLVVVDGPLRGRRHRDVVGYIKTQHVQYLPPSHQQVVVDLAAGERTPLFEVVTRGFARRSWYLRLPTDADYALAGVVRCEVIPGDSVDADRERADMITSLVQRFASEPHKDGRAPQNLYPIAGLEHRLRHLLGDQALLERSLRKQANASQTS